MTILKTVPPAPTGGPAPAGRAEGDVTVPAPISRAYHYRDGANAVIVAGAVGGILASWSGIVPGPVGFLLGGAPTFVVAAVGYALADG